MRKTKKLALLASLAFTQLTALASQLPLPRDYPPSPPHLPRMNDLWIEMNSHDFYFIGKGLFHQRGAGFDDCALTYQALFSKTQTMQVKQLFT